jgi:signal transduction histidine kinase
LHLRPNQIIWNLLLNLLIGSGTCGFAASIDKVTNSLVIPQKSILYLADPLNNFVPAQVLQRLDSFKPIETVVFSKPPGIKTYWFVFSAQNLTHEVLWMQISTLFAWEIDIYLIDKDESHSILGYSGLRRVKRPNKLGHDAFLLPLAQAIETEPRKYLIRVYEPAPFELPLAFGTYETLKDYQQEHDFLLAIFLGMVGIMLFYNLMLYLQFRDPLYLLYLFYVVCVTPVICHGNGFPLLDRLFPAFDWHRYLFTWFFPMYISIAWFTISYLQLRKRLPLMYASILASVALAGLMAVLNFWYETIKLALFYEVSLGLLVISCLSSGFWLLIKGVQEARFYVIGWGVLMSSFFIYVGTLYGLLPYNLITRNITYFAMALELGFFSIALGDRFNQFRLLHKKAQDELLQQTLQNEQMQKDLNERLAIEVDNKTEELQRTIRELHLSLAKVQEQTQVISQQSLEIRQINEGLESLIEEKTKLIRQQNEQLKAYAFANSHKVRGPLARIMGLITLIQVEREKNQGESYLRMLHQCAGELDDIIREMNGILVEAKIYE